MNLTLREIPKEFGRTEEWIDENGLVQGVRKKFYHTDGKPPGWLHEEMEMKDSKKNGFYHRYDQFGNLVETGFYLDDHKTSDWEKNLFAKRGNEFEKILVSKCTYVKGKYDGRRIDRTNEGFTEDFYREGKLLSHKVFHDNSSQNRGKLKSFTKVFYDMEENKLAEIKIVNSDMFAKVLIDFLEEKPSIITTEQFMTFGEVVMQCKP